MTRHLYMDTEENNEKPQSGWPASSCNPELLPLEHKLEVLPLQPTFSLIVVFYSVWKLL
jgi:hypothetical protein